MRYAIEIKYKPEGAKFYLTKHGELVSDRKFAAKFWTYRGAQAFRDATAHQPAMRLAAENKISRR